MAVHAKISNENGQKIKKFGHLVVFYLAIIVVFVSPWRNIVNFEGIGSIGRVLGLILLVAWTIYTLSFSRSVELPHYLIWFYMLSLVLFLSTFWSINQSASFTYAIRFFSITLLLTVYWNVFDSLNKVKYSLQAVVFGGIVISVTTIYLASIGMDHPAAADIRYGPLFVPNVNIAGGLGVFTIGASVYLVIDNYINKYYELINLIYIPLGSVAVILTGSRAALVALVPIIMTAVYKITSNLSRKNVIQISIPLCASLFISLRYHFENLFSRDRLDYYSTILESIMTLDFGTRTVRMEAGFSAIQESFTTFLVGHGAFTFGPAVEPHIGWQASAHSVFMEVLVGVGVIGISILAVIYLYSLNNAIKSGKYFEWVAIVFAAIILSMTNDWEMSITMWFLLLSCVRINSLTKVDKVNRGTINPDEIVSEQNQL